MEQDNKLDWTKLRLNNEEASNIDAFIKLRELNLITSETVLSSLYLYEKKSLTADQTKQLIKQLEEKFELCLI